MEAQRIQKEEIAFNAVVTEADARLEVMLWAQDWFLLHFTHGEVLTLKLTRRQKRLAGLCEYCLHHTRDSREDSRLRMQRYMEMWTLGNAE